MTGIFNVYTLEDAEGFLLDMEINEQCVVIEYEEEFMSERFGSYFEPCEKLIIMRYTEDTWSIDHFVFSLRIEREMRNLDLVTASNVLLEKSYLSGTSEMFCKNCFFCLPTLKETFKEHGDRSVQIDRSFDPKGRVTKTTKVWDRPDRIHENLEKEIEEMLPFILNMIVDELYYWDETWEESGLATVQDITFENVREFIGRYSDYSPNFTGFFAEVLSTISNAEIFELESDDADVFELEAVNANSSGVYVVNFDVGEGYYVGIDPVNYTNLVENQEGEYVQVYRYKSDIELDDIQVQKLGKEFIENLFYNGTPIG